jgi:hypothetical protein
MGAILISRTRVSSNRAAIARHCVEIFCPSHQILLYKAWLICRIIAHIINKLL